MIKNMDDWKIDFCGCIPAFKSRPTYSIPEQSECTKACSELLRSSNLQ